MEKQFVVGVDVGGQTSKIGVVDARGDVLVQSVIRTDGHSDAADFIAALAAAIKELVVKADKVGSLQSYWLIILCLAYLVFYAIYGSKNVNKDIKVD